MPCSSLCFSLTSALTRDWALVLRRSCNVLEIILLLVMLVLSASFSGAETAFFSLGPAEVAHMRQSESKAGQRVVGLLARSHDLLSALLIGNLLVNIVASVEATSLFIAWLGPKGVVIAVPVTTIVLLLVGEITPKMLALRFREPIALAVQGPVTALLQITRPLIWLSRQMTSTVVRLLPWSPTGSLPMTNSELQTACDIAIGDGMLTEIEGRSLARLLSLSDLEVAGIMTPRTAVVTLHQDMSLKQILATARRAGFNRYLVTGAEGQSPVGLFHLKDLLGLSPVPEFPLQDNLRELLFVPESKDVDAMLAEMGDGGAHLAAVIDEHGDYTGIVTMADCLQALLGPVADADDQGTEVIPLGGQRWIIGGRTDLRELEEACGLRLPPSNDYVTVTGYLMKNLGRILSPGDRVTLADARLTVLDMSGHRVDRIKVTLRSEAGTNDQEVPM
jgi:putative hemolysin